MIYHSHEYFLRLATLKPRKRLLALAAAEAADPSHRVKFKEQRNFVLWLDRMGEKRLCLCHLLSHGRIAFVCPYGEANAPVQGSAFFYLGSSPSRFVEEFAAVGLVVLPVVALAKGVGEHDSGEP